MHEKLRRARTAFIACVIIIICASAGVHFVASRQPPTVSNETARIILPLTLLVFLAFTIGAVCLSFVHRSQSLSRVSGMRRDRAADLLLPMYASLSYFRCVLLLVPSFLAILAYLLIARLPLLLIPTMCVAMLLLWLPVRSRFEKWVEDAVSFG